MYAALWRIVHLQEDARARVLADGGRGKTLILTALRKQVSFFNLYVKRGFKLEYFRRSSFFISEKTLSQSPSVC